MLFSETKTRVLKTKALVFYLTIEKISKNMFKNLLAFLKNNYIINYIKELIYMAVPAEIRAIERPKNTVVKKSGSMWA
ncbi:hypothetical protein, partial [Mycoplasmopsis bovis]|uniref:hypothetical protein n=2 Tax=Mycoplasmopsis bovis TaxID=28903 RepID=UPI003D2DC840